MAEAVQRRLWVIEGGHVSDDCLCQLLVLKAVKSCVIVTFSVVGEVSNCAGDVLLQCTLSCVWVPVFADEPKGKNNLSFIFHCIKCTIV